MYFYMQFILLEPNTQRSADAAEKIHALLYKGIEYKENGDVTVYVNPAQHKDEGDFSSLELALSISATASTTGEENKNKTDIQKYVESLVGFVQICKEIEDDKLTSTFTWQYAAKNIINLQSSAKFETYAYILAAKAEMVGISERLGNYKKRGRGVIICDKEFVVFYHGMQIVFIDVKLTRIACINATSLHTKTDAFAPILGLSLDQISSYSIKSRALLNPSTRSANRNQPRHIVSQPTRPVCLVSIHPPNRAIA